MTEYVLVNEYFHIVPKIALQPQGNGEIVNICFQILHTYLWHSILMGIPYAGFYVQTKQAKYYHPARCNLKTMEEQVYV